MESGEAPNASLVAVSAEQQRLLSAMTMTNKTDRWVWEYCGRERDAPPQRVLVEKPMGPFERQLLRLSAGTSNIYDCAEAVKMGF